MEDQKNIEAEVHIGTQWNILSIVTNGSGKREKRTSEQVQAYAEDASVADEEAISTKPNFDKRLMPLLNKARQQGWLDENYMPVEKVLTRPQLAYMAHAIAVDNKLEDKWSTHFDFWGIKNLRNYYYRALNQDGISPFMKELDEKLGTKEY